jgi:glutamate synthase domain-containing protein 3
VARSPLGEALAADAASAIASGTPVRVAYPIQNTDRAVGTRLAGTIAASHPEGLPDGTVGVRLSGTAGQSLGAFLSPGIEIRLDGTANDYVGKGMGGGTIIIVPQSPGPAHGAGNAVLYGATGGRLFVRGSVGQRFAVRNSGAAAVVEGCGDHGAEYMTGGVAVVLGPVGRNTAAGMTGGVLFVHDPEGSAAPAFAETAPRAARPHRNDMPQLRAMLEAHAGATGSEAAAAVLRGWEHAAAEFWVLRASAPALTAPIAAGMGTNSPGTVL